MARESRLSKTKNKRRGVLGYAKNAPAGVAEMSKQGSANNVVATAGRGASGLEGTDELAASLGDTMVRFGQGRSSCLHIEQKSDGGSCIWRPIDRAKSIEVCLTLRELYL